MIQIVPAVILQFLHVELHPAHLVGVVVRSHQPVVVVIVNARVGVSGPVYNDVDCAASQREMVKIFTN